MTDNLKKNIELFDSLLHTDRTFDVLKTTMKAGNREACYYYIEGFVNSADTLRFHEKICYTKDCDYSDMDEYARAVVPRIESFVSDDDQKIVDAVLCGNVAMFIDGYSQALVIDVRTYPDRGVEEPEKSRTLRGPHIGFNENLTKNTILIRRYIRTPELSFERFSVGDISKTDVAMVYIADRVDMRLVDKIREKITKIKTKALCMSQESLAEQLLKNKKWLNLNPFPKVKYIERPDSACAELMEGKLLVIVDNSPSVMLFPTNILDFFDDVEEYYFPPVTASYLKVVRILTYFAGVFLVPIWYLAVHHAHRLPEYLSFVKVTDEYAVPIILQILIIETAIDGLKLASMNSPSQLQNSVSIVGGLILGDFAVKSGWFISPVILYTAFSAIATFSPTNYELGYCFKFMRISLVVFTWLFDIWGFVAVLAVWLLILCLNRTVADTGYLYPIIPFDKNGFKKIFVRSFSGKEQK
ncbi:MAG: spore germination protein [Ruminococcaceae bacterium]|nr:spore germination protein [Oscillospiraceae bacterium]